MQVTTVGMDLAKNVVHIHGVDARGDVVLRKRLPRKQVLPSFAQLPPCLIGLKASEAAHHWARELTKQMWGQRSTSARISVSLTAHAVGGMPPCRSKSNSSCV